MGIVGAGVAILARTINGSLSWKFNLLIAESGGGLESIANDNLTIDNPTIASASLIPFFSKILKHNKKIIYTLLSIILIVNAYNFYPNLIDYINLKSILYFIFIFTLFIFYNIFKLILYINIMNFKGSLKEHKFFKILPNYFLDKYIILNNSKSKDFLIPHFFKLLIFYILMLLILIIISLIIVHLS
jgi:hypothetical protein